MNMKSIMLASASAVAVFLPGCMTSSRATIEPSRTNVETPRKVVQPRKMEVQKPQPTPRERAKGVCNDLWTQVKPFLVKHDYHSARRVALSERDKVDAEIGDMVLSFRVGLVTSIINPAELEWRIDELSKKVETFCTAGDFQSAYAALEKEKSRWNDAEFTDVHAALSKVHKELGALYYSDSAAKAYVDKHRARIEKLINDRKGGLVMRQGVSSEIDRLEAIIKEAMPKEQRSAVDEIIKGMKSDLGIRNLTTLSLDRSMATSVGSMRDAVKGGQRRFDEIVAIRFASIRAKIAIRQAIAQGIDLTDEIDAMEIAAIRNLSGRGGLFAECARGLRTLFPANSTGQLDYQDLLSAAVLLNRRELMEMAIKCGADAKNKASHDPAKTPPLLLAAEVGSKSSIAWLCDKGAQEQLPHLSMAALKIAVKKNRLDLFKYLQKIGCSLANDDVQGVFALCCETGADNLHEYLCSIGAKPTTPDFVKAVKADNLIIVKWFVEKHYFSVNEPGVAAASKDCLGVRNYLHGRGMR